MIPYWIGRGPGYQRRPQVSHSRAPVEIMLLLNIVKKEQKERRKASETPAGSVEKLIHKGGYLEYCNNDCKGKRAGRIDGVKECRHIVPTGNKIERE